jgi:hypothetical protein
MNPAPPVTSEVGTSTTTIAVPWAFQGAAIIRGERGFVLVRVPDGRHLLARNRLLVRHADPLAHRRCVVV